MQIKKTLEGKLHRCPFCGGTSMILRDSEDDKIDAKYRVVCKKCSASSAPFEYQYKAVQEWQKRVNQSKSGHWIDGMDERGEWMKCSVCGTLLRRADYHPPFCQECGSRNIVRKRIGLRNPSVNDQIEGSRRIRDRNIAQKTDRTIENIGEGERMRVYLRRKMADENK